MKKEHNYFIYLMASDSGTLYVGVTNDILRRVWEHKQGIVGGFTKEYRCNKLVYYEHYTDVFSAKAREQ